MDIKICKTSEWTRQEWTSYIDAFNEVFGKDFSHSYFFSKYTHVEGGNSFHALLKSDTGEVVGACSVIPCRYRRGDTPFLLGLVVDVFIREAYRTDPLMLRRMYKRLCALLRENEIVAILAVPNATAYPYWKNVVKWKDVGDIDYWVLPLRIGNFLGKLRFLNICSLLYAYSALFISSLFLLLNRHSRQYAYRIDSNDAFLRHHYEGDCVIHENDNSFYAYRLVDEDRIKTAYIYDAVKDGKFSFHVLLKCTKSIFRAKPDLIIYVGKMGCLQTLFIKVPRRFEPKRLPLMCDMIKDQDQYLDIFQIKLWDFGLKNYDVR